MKHAFSLFFGLFCLASPLAAQVSGRAWLDANANGRHEPTEGGLRLTVRAYGAAGQLLAQTTAQADGSYYLSEVGSQPLRLEFSNLPTGLHPVAGHRLVRFVVPPAEVPLALHRPAHYTGPGARVAQAVYVNGEYSTPQADSLAALVAFPARSPQGTPHRLASPRQVGSLWGLAYDRTRGCLFTAAVAKRHSAFGPLGSGGLYVVWPDSGTVRPLLNLDARGIATAPRALPRDLPGAPGAFSHDSLLFAGVGKTSLGGLDVSDDGRTLYVMNLYDRSLYGIGLNADVQPGEVTAHRLPEPGCAGGTFRPFAVKVHAGRVYVGGVCDAAQSGRATDLRAIVYAFDPGAQSFNEVVNIRLDYPRGVLDYGVSGWQAWTDDYRQATVPQAPNWLIRPQPMLADIEFDTDGAMILGLMDRLGHQTADGNYVRPAGSRQLQQYRGLSGGDVLRVAYRANGTSSGHFELERNARADGHTTEGRGTEQGPAGGEFYFDDAFRGGGRTWHQETATGGLALLPDRNEVLVATREPLTDQYTTGGVRWFSNETGQATAGYAVFPGGEKAGYVWKANPVGDVEVLAETPPTEVGDRVWLDRNQNGLQDADEPGLGGLTVGLYRNGKALTTARTDADGYYHFDEVALKTGLKAHAAGYEIRVALRQDTHGPLRLPETPARRGTLATDWPAHLDNDAVARRDTAVVAFATGTPGEHRHDLDIGLYADELNRSAEAPSLRLKLTPNPTAGQVRVTYQGLRPSGSLTVRLLSADGQVLQTHAATLHEQHCQQTLSLAALPTGVYFVAVEEEGTTTTERLVKH